MNIIKFILLLLILIFSPTTSIGQGAQRKQPPKTINFAGEYQYGGDPEKGPYGLVSVYAKDDSRIMFYLELGRGAPSYNMGSIWGEVVIKNSKGLFVSSLEGRSCQFILNFYSNQLVIKTIDNQDGCGFGGGVLADGTFKKVSTKNPEYFIDNGSMEKIFFKDLIKKNNASR